MRMALTIALFACVPVTHADPVRHRIAVASVDAGGAGVLQSFAAQAPWGDVSAPIAIPPDALLRYAFGRIYVISAGSGLVLAVDPAAWSVVRSYSVPAAPQDIAVVSPREAFVSLGADTRLHRLDLASGALQPVADLAPFADGDGNPDMAALAIVGNRLFVALRRINMLDGSNEPPSLAVIDIVSGDIVDADPATQGLQAIALAGTFPKGRMIAQAARHRLVVNASGVFFDFGGIELVDTDALMTLGLVVAEADAQSGADLGGFTMTRPDAGFLVFSTDFALSSHLVGFTEAGGVNPGGELYSTLSYLSPVLVHDPQPDLLYMPVAGTSPSGVHVFDASTGARLTPAPLSFGRPTDLLLYYAGCGAPGDANGDGVADAGDIPGFIDCRVAPGPGCDCLDFDADGAMDENDAAALARLLLAG